MTKVCPEEFIEFANALADAARPVIRRHFRTPIAVDTKSDESPVTIADRDAESAMRSLIAATYPDHGIFGEEYGRSNSDAQYTWVLDPIDGTKAFITGRPIFGTLVALVRDGIPILGVIDQAILDERWVGATGHATTFNDAVVETRRCSSLAKAIVNTTSPDMFNAAEKSAFAALSKAAGTTIYGGDCYGYALVASGFVDIVVESDLKPYDFCALVPVIEGAGGSVTDWNGEPLTIDSAGDVLALGDASLLPAAMSALSAGSE